MVTSTRNERHAMTLSSSPCLGLCLHGEAKGRLCVIQMLQEAIEVLAIKDGEGVVYVVFPIPKLVRNDK